MALTKKQDAYLAAKIKQFNNNDKAIIAWVSGIVSAQLLDAELSRDAAALISSLDDQIEEIQDKKVRLDVTIAALENQKNELSK